jgi:hypothetical protein
MGLERSTSRNGLPHRVALGHVGIIARRIGAVIPDLSGIRLVVAIIAVEWIIAPPGVGERSTEEKPAIVKTTVVKPAIAKPVSVEPAPAEPAKSSPVEPTHPMKSAVVEAAKSTAVEPGAPTMRSGKGEIWLAERDSAQQ